MPPHCYIWTQAQTLIQDTDFTLTVKSENEMTFTRKASGMGWMEVGKAGPLFLRSVTPPSVGSKDKKTFDLAGGEGIRIAVVFQDPVLEAASESDTLHNSQSKVHLCPYFTVLECA